jgi:S-adenosylmethionine decarboxylase
MTAFSYFEGSEKKLEIILNRPFEGLRTNTDGRWNRIVEACGARIISRISSRLLDAYLLSESSLFVWDDRLLMVTCGQTVLIKSFIKMKKLLPKNRIAFLFYERKNMLYPGKQRSSFEEDLSVLERYFSGQHFRLGSLARDHVDVFYATMPNNNVTQDATFQLLMHELKPGLANIFGLNHSQPTFAATSTSSLGRLYEGMQTDDHLFSPFGYSLNGIKGGHYLTVHVTPQPGASYASFETNVIETDYSRITQAVTDIFSPQRLTAVLTSNVSGDLYDVLRSVTGPLKNYRITEQSHHELEGGYHNLFLNCERHP